MKRTHRIGLVHRQALPTAALWFALSLIAQAQTPSVKLTLRSYWPGFASQHAIMDIKVVGNQAFLAGLGGLAILDVTNPGHPVPVGGGIPVSAGDCSSEGIDVAGEFAHLAGRGGLMILSLTNQNQATYVGGHTTSDWASHVRVIGDFAYVTAGGRLQVFDVTDRTKPRLVGTGVIPGGDARRLEVVANHAFVGAGSAGLQVVDVSNPTAPGVVGSYATDGEASGVSVAGGYAYLAVEGSGLEIIDVRMPANPVFVGRCTTPGSAFSVRVNGDYAYVGDRGTGRPDYQGLHVIDIGNPAGPVAVGVFPVELDGRGSGGGLRHSSGREPRLLGGPRSGPSDRRCASPVKPRARGGVQPGA